MKKQDYHASIQAPVSAADAFAKTMDMRLWWTENIEGRSAAVGDVSIIHFGETFVTLEVTELHAPETITWMVTDCYLPWLQDKHEWTGTQLRADISTKDGLTQVDFFHLGLVPGIECYDGCVRGWDQYFKDSLNKLLNEGKGLPQQKAPIAEKAAL